jgi:putative transposase
MARVLGVSKAGDHAWVKRPPSAHAELRARGKRHGRKRVARLRREAGLVRASHRRAAAR